MNPRGGAEIPSGEMSRALKAQADYKAALAGATSLEEIRQLDATEIPKWSGPLPEDIEVAEIDLNGVSAVSLPPPDVVSGRVLMYLHGGGLVLGSPATVTTPVGKAAR